MNFDCPLFCAQNIFFISALSLLPSNGIFNNKAPHFGILILKFYRDNPCWLGVACNRSKQPFISRHKTEITEINYISAVAAVLVLVF